MNKTQIVQVSLKDIDLLPNIRTEYDEIKIKELADSISENGILCPPLLRVHPEKSGRFQLVAGKRRYLASKSIKLDMIPVVIMEIKDEDIETAQIIENLQRENISRMDEAVVLKKLKEEKSLSDGDIAKRLGKTTSYVTLTLKLNDLTPIAQKAFKEKIFDVGVASMLCKLQPSDQMKALEKCWTNEYYHGKLQKNFYSLRSLQHWIQSEIMLELKGAPFNLDDEKLVEGCPSCTVCPKRTINSNVLFSEITDTDKCTDSGCFKLKTQAHVKNQLEKAKKDSGSEEVARARASAYSSNVKIGKDQFTIVKKGDKGAIPAVITNVDNAYDAVDKKKVGKIVYVKKQPSHNLPSSSKPKTAEDKAKEDATKKKVKALRFLLGEMLFNKIRDGKYKLNDQIRINIMKESHEVDFAALAYFTGVTKEMAPSDEYQNFKLTQDKRDACAKKLAAMGLEKCVLMGYPSSMLTGWGMIEKKGDLIDFCVACGVDVKKETKEFSKQYDQLLKDRQAVAEKKK